jgi:hypothetical protein
VIEVAVTSYVGKLIDNHIGDKMIPPSNPSNPPDKPAKNALYTN